MRSDVQSWVGERQSSKKQTQHLLKLLEIGFVSPAEFRDEVFLIAIKQSRNCPNPLRALECWKALAVLSSTFPPSERCFYPFLNYFKSQALTNKNTEVREWARYIFARILKVYENESRRGIPSLNEIEAILNKKQMPLRVYFMNGHDIVLYMESYTTIKHLRDEIVQKTQLKKEMFPYFSIYEVCEKKETYEERYLENDVLLSDVLDRWDKEKDTDSAADFKLYFRIRIFFPLDYKEEDSVVMFYNQMLYEYRLGRYPCEEKDVVTLAALACQNEFGNSLPEPDAEFRYFYLL